MEYKQGLYSTPKDPRRDLQCNNFPYNFYVMKIEREYYIHEVLKKEFFLFFSWLHNNCYLAGIEIPLLICMRNDDRRMTFQNIRNRTNMTNYLSATPMINSEFKRASGNDNLNWINLEIYFLDLSNFFKS